jgi:protein-disulfide isomerase
VDEERFNACYLNADHAAEVAADLKEAQKFYILGTPTFFVNGQRLEGALPTEIFAEVIDAILGA